MTRWVPVSKKSDIPEGKTAVFNVEGKEIAISYVNGEFYAFINQCSHMELPLEEGTIEGTTIECPFHGAKFDLQTGAALQLPAASPIQVFKVRIEGGEIQVEFKD